MEPTAAGRFGDKQLVSAMTERDAVLAASLDDDKPDVDFEP